MINILDGIIYWMIVLLPFGMAISNGLMNSFMGALIGFFLIKKVLKKECVFVKTSINIPLLALFLITCFSIINSAFIKDSVRGGILRLLQYIFVIFAIIDGVKDKKHVFKIVISIAFCLLLISIDSIWQVFIGKDFIRGNLPIINIGLVRATASFIDANVLGIYLSAITPLFFGLTLYYFKAWKRILFCFLSLLGLVGLALTYSRPTLLAAYIVLLFLAIAKKSKVLIIILLLFIIIAPFILPKSVKQWAKEMEYNPIRFMCNDDRIAIFRNAMQMIKASPVIGHGANTFNKNYINYKEKPEYRNIVTSNTIYAHNNFLHMAGEIGIVGLGLFIWLLFELFIACSGIYHRFKDSFLKTFSLSLIACLIAFLVNGLTESSLYYSRVALIFWYFIGLSLALNKLNEEK